MADEPTISALEAIHTTRAIRRFKSDPIPDDVLWAILDAAIRGPTGANRQNWGWVLVRESDAKRKIAGWFKQEYDNTYGRVDESTLTETGRIESGTFTVNEEIDYGLDAGNYRAVKHLAHHLAEAPGDRLPGDVRRPRLSPAGAEPAARRRLDLRCGAEYDAGRARARSRLRDHGLGRRHAGAARAAGLPEGYEPMALVPMGYPTAEFSQPGRRPVDQVTHWERWGEQRSRPAD